jgi:hypothetical protein
LTENHTGLRQNPERESGSIPRGFFSILRYQDAFNIRPVWLTGLPVEVPPFQAKAGVFHFLGVFASGSLRGVLGGEATISLQYGVV